MPKAAPKLAAPTLVNEYVAPTSAQECVTQVPVVTLVAPDTVPPLEEVAAHVVSHVIQEQIAVGEATRTVVDVPQYSITTHPPVHLFFYTPACF